MSAREVYVDAPDVDPKVRWCTETDDLFLYDGELKKQRYAPAEPPELVVFNGRIYERWVPCTRS